MQTVKACRACLVTNVKLYSMEDSFISNAYTKLTGLNNIGPPVHVCYECTALLKKCERFRLKCMNAHAVLVNFVTKNTKITQDILASVDRKRNKLESLLTLTQLELCDINSDGQITGTCANNTNIVLDIVKKEDGGPQNQQDMEVYKYLQIEIEPTANTDNKHTVLLPCDNIDSNKLSECSPERSPSPASSSSSASLPSPASSPAPTVTRRKRQIKPTTRSKQTKKAANAESKAKKSNVNSRKKAKLDVESAPSKPSKVAKTTKAKTKKGPKSSLDESFYEGYATIVLLTPEQARNEVLQRKDSSNYVNCQFKCNLCYKGYGAQTTYENHMKKHSPDNGPHECVHCHMRFRTLTLLSRHRQTCHKRKFYCQICPYVCFSPHQAKTHVNLHKGQKYQCDECSAIFSMPNSLSTHKRIKHATECVCDLCGSTFLNDRGLHSHKIVAHKQETNTCGGPSCQECGVHFANDTAYKRHLVLSARHTVSHGCGACGETFDSDAAFKKHHAQMHSRKNSVTASPCTLCGVWLRNSAARRSHALSVHGIVKMEKEPPPMNDNEPRCMCEVCGKVFKRAFFMAVHSRIHSGEKSYACKECGKKFATSMALGFHRDKHSVRARYRCKICSKEFKFRTSLHTHVKVSHHGYRPHKCHLCEKSFPNPCDVRAHIQHVHDKVPWPKRNPSRRQPAETAVLSAPYTFDYKMSDSF